MVVSTNSEEIARVARSAGAEVPFLRPDTLSQANSSSLSAILHALHWFRDSEKWTPDFVAFCPPTNPFIRSQTIKEMFNRLAARPDRNSIVSIAPPKTHPFRIVERQKDGTIRNGLITIESKSINDIERSQDWPAVWEGSPACRLTRSSYFLSLPLQNGPQSAQGKTYDVQSALGYEVTQLEAFDIDEEQDFSIAAALAQTLRHT